VELPHARSFHVFQCLYHQLIHLVDTDEATHTWIFEIYSYMDDGTKQLAFACVLTMIVVPVLYAIFFGVREDAEELPEPV
jgi:hypothetical protein